MTGPFFDKEGVMRTAMSAIAAAVLLGACSAGSVPPRPTPTHPVPSATTSPPRTGPLTTGAGVLPGEKPPVEPAIAKTHTDAGALAFAMYYKHSLDWSLATADPFLLRTVSSKTCDACNRYIQSLETLRSVHGYVVGGRIEVGRTTIVEGHVLVKADLVVQVETVQGPTAIVKPPVKASPVSTDAQHVTSFVYESWLNDAWTVEGDFGP